MADLISQLQSQSGLDADAVKGGMGALFNFLKEQLPEDLFSKVEAAVPDAQGMIGSFLSGQQAPGVLNKVGGLIGNLFGESMGDLPRLFEMISKSGLSLDQAKAFLPAAIGVLKGALPDELVEQIMSRLPGLGEAMAQADS